MVRQRERTFARAALRTAASAGMSRRSSRALTSLHNVQVDVNTAPGAEGGARAWGEWGATTPPRPRGSRWPSGQGSSEEVAVHVADRVGADRGTQVRG